MSMHIDIAEKEPKMNMVMHNKIQDLDIISTMPDGVISHIMNFLITKQAVQTCILSKRWKDLWKSLPTFKISREHFGSAEQFKKFVSKVLQNREESSLHSVVVEHQGYTPSNILSKMTNIALSKKVEKFIVGTFLRDQKSNMLPFHSIFFLRSLKCLDLTFHTNGSTKVKLPETIYLPELVECHLRDVAITSSGGNDCVNPFIESKKLITLVMDHCELIGDAKMVFISGDNLASVTIRFREFDGNFFKFQISAPNLKAFNFVGYLASKNNQIFEHNLEFIEVSSITAYSTLYSPEDLDILKNWFKRISNVRSLILSSMVLKCVSSFTNFPNIESSGFGNLKSLTVILQKGVPITCLYSIIMDYLLQDSPHAEIIQGGEYTSEFSIVFS
ncbi:unnamed protein product [Trifolium pratense]|uniref:Uncharacterized protein n=1 Tax=Trifolium pratense TaxID=57577 RepID=A0ACB0J5T3_TRIPR|nr:unnamed protein product [Trifolium pratense]